jgi:murein DD-endopeptidase MepM/ murein hydrolase activator NlpD
MTVLVTITVLAVLAASASQPAASTEAHWAWPTAARDVVNAWGDPADEYAPGHRGIDVAAGPGEPARSPDDGVVKFAGPVAGRSVVVVDHGEGLRSTLDAVDPSVHKGDLVARGQIVGTVSGSHCAEPSPCLHLGARIDGEYVDPMQFLVPLSWPVLLPLSEWKG